MYSMAGYMKKKSTNYMIIHKNDAFLNFPDSQFIWYRSETDPARSGRRDLVQIQLRGTRSGPNGEIDLAFSFWPDLAK